MYLLLDNSSADKIIWTTGDREVFEFRPAIGVLASLDKLLKKKKARLGDIAGLAVVVGKGRFTSTRVAATIVNTLAYALGAPALAVDDDGGEWMNKLSVQPVGQYVSARYSAPANVGGKKLET